MLTAIDLFAGGGGFSLGAHEARFHVSHAVEIDRSIAAAYARNFPHTDVHVKDVNEESVIARLTNSPVDLVFGGPPCQGFSQIGKRDILDVRNELLGRFLSVVEQILPRAFVVENVPEAFGEANKRSYASELEAIRKDYNVFGPLFLTASDYGVPTRRRRGFLVGFRRDIQVNGFEVEPSSSLTPTAREVVKGLYAASSPEAKIEGFGLYHIHGEPRESRLCDWNRPPVTSEYGATWAVDRWREGLITGCEATAHQPTTVARFAAVLPGKRDPVGRFQRIDGDGLCPTIRAGTGRERGSFQSVRPIHPTEPRVITVREAARFQGFPDWFLFDPTKWHSFRIIGNSVSPIVAREILSRIHDVLVKRGARVNSSTRVRWEGVGA